MLLAQRVGAQRDGVGAVGGGRDRREASVAGRLAGARAEPGHPGSGVDLGQAGGEAVGDRLGEQDLRRGGAQPLAHERAEGVALGAGRDQRDPRLGAQLAAERAHRRRQPVGDAGGASAQRCLGDDERVEAAHLRVHGDRPRAVGRVADDRPAAAERAGEGDRLDAVIANELLCQREPGLQHVAERALGQAGPRRRLAQQPRDERPRLRVGGMALDHHRAAGRQRRGRVATGRAEGQREVGGAEHGHRADGEEHAADVGTRTQTHPPDIRVGGVDDDLEMVARGDDAGQHLQLDRGALELAVEAGFGQARLAPGQPDDLGALVSQPRGGAGEHRGAPRCVGQARVAGGPRGGGDDGVELGGGRLRELGAGFAGAGVDPVQGGRHG